MAKIGGPRRVDREHAPSDGRDVRARAQKACAIVHGRGYRMSANELLELILEEGMPPRVERERILAAKLADGDNTTLSSSPSA